MRRIIRIIFCVPIKIYQLCISSVLPPCCRYYPTCSQYMIDAISKYGIINGLLMGLKRILRCHPFGGSGYDPLP